MFGYLKICFLCLGADARLTHESFPNFLDAFVDLFSELVNLSEGNVIDLANGCPDFWAIRLSKLEDGDALSALTDE